MAEFRDFQKSLDVSPAKRGKQFEQFVKWFLKNEPEWITQVDQVWLWDEYPDRWGKDCGIDLIFKHKNGELWAVQAKCYSPEHDITKHDVDKFLSESNRRDHKYYRDQIRKSKQKEGAWIKKRIKDTDRYWDLRRNKKYIENTQRITGGMYGRGFWVSSCNKTRTNQ